MCYCYCCCGHGCLASASTDEYVYTILYIHVYVKFYEHLVAVVLVVCMLVLYTSSHVGVFGCHGIH